MTRNQKGFTLVEIAIVLVIIGLLIGGVLKGQSMIQNAKVKRVVKSADELRAGFYTFYDKYGVFPGDENIAAIPPGDTGTDGDGSGQISIAEAPRVYLDLALANIISGNFDGTAATMPRHAFGDVYQVYWTTRAGRQDHFIRYDNLPPDVAQEIDTKYDDGVYNTGSITANVVYTSTLIGNFFMPL